VIFLDIPILAIPLAEIGISAIMDMSKMDTHGVFKSKERY
jgi:hypothetical protein